MTCRPCLDFCRRHRQGLVRAGWLLLLALFFFWVGRAASPISAPGFCLVYP